MASLKDIEAKLATALKTRKFRTTVAIDGSSLSDEAMKVAAGFNYASRSDKLQIMHISDASKANLPPNLKPSHLQNVYEGQALGFHVHCEWVLREKDRKFTTCDNVVFHARKLDTDMLVLGSYGRKGEKADVLGSVTDKSLREASSSVAIVRMGGGPVPGKASTILFATDGSRAAGLAFVLLLTRLRQKNDKVVVISVQYEEPDADKLVEYQEMLEAKKIADFECRPYVIGREKTVVDGVLEAAEEVSADCIVLGISGANHKSLGSVSMGVVTRAVGVTTVIVRDNYHVTGEVSTGF